MLEGAMLVWFILTGLSIAFVIWDSVFNGVTSWVQRAAWILVTLYTGPIGAFMYTLACRRPFPGGHDRYTVAPWKQGLNSEMHCLAGDATGIVVAAALVPTFQLANGWDLLIEYSAGFVSGLFIFQALMMAGMYGGDYFKAVRKTFFAEAVSMNMVMAGMIPTMVLLAALWPHSHDPLRPEFWFHMSLATIVGGLVAFPINYWLVKNHLKHGCMTLPNADSPAPTLGHRSPEKPEAMSAHDGITMTVPAMNHTMADHDMAGAADGQHPDHHHAAMDTAYANNGEHVMPMSDHQHHAMAMRELSPASAAAWIVGSFAVLLGAVLLTSHWVPIAFS